MKSDLVAEEPDPHADRLPAALGRRVTEALRSSAVVPSKATCRRRFLTHVLDPQVLERSQHGRLDGERGLRERLHCATGRVAEAGPGSRTAVSGAPSYAVSAAGFIVWQPAQAVEASIAAAVNAIRRMVRLGQCGCAFAAGRLAGPVGRLTTGHSSVKTGSSLGVERLLFIELQVAFRTGPGGSAPSARRP